MATEVLTPGKERVRQLRETLPDGSMKVNLHPGQYKAYHSEARFPLVLAGLQSGKTSFGPHWLDQEIERAYDKLQPGEPIGDFLVVTTTWDLFKLKVLPELRNVFETRKGIAYYWADSKIIELRQDLHREGRLWAKRPSDEMYGRILLRSAEAVSGLASATAKAAWCDEIGQPEFSLEAYEEIVARVSLHRGRILGTTTIYNLGWLKTEWYDKAMDGDPNYAVFQFDSTANPMFDPKEFDRISHTMPPWKFNMRYRGLYEKPAGMVYSTFNEKESLVEWFDPPKNWHWYVGHDFGSQNPAALFYVTEPGSNIYWLVYEFLPEEPMPIYDQVEQFKKWTKDRIVVRRSGGNWNSEEGWRNNYTLHGWHVTKPDEGRVDVGIANVFGLHSVNAIKVMDTNKKYLNEKMNYSYKLTGTYEVTDEILDKSRKHLMDAERSILGGIRTGVDVNTEGPNQVFHGSW